LKPAPKEKRRTYFISVRRSVLRWEEIAQMGTTVIAEVGLNHNGKLDTALRLCDAAKSAGADIVKTQTYVPHKCIRKGRDYDSLSRLALTSQETRKMANHCDDIGVEFCSTPDDLDSLKLLVDECGVKRIKLGSGSLLYGPLVDAAFDTGLPVLLSTGMASLDEVQKALGFIRVGKVIAGGTTLLHCVSLYPCPPHLANVSAMVAMRRFGLPVGYSDHTIGNYAILSAVALGATVVEKHFTLDNEAEGPDHRMSATPEQFERMVMKIRMVETVLGHGRKEPSPEELAMIPRIRKDSEGFQPGL